MLSIHILLMKSNAVCVLQFLFILKTPVMQGRVAGLYIKMPLEGYPKKKQLCICDLGQWVVQVYGHEPVLWLHGLDHIYHCVPCKKWGGLPYQFHLYPRQNKLLVRELQLCSKTCTMKNLRLASGSLFCFPCDIITTLGLTNLLEWPKLAPSYLELLGWHAKWVR